MKIALIIIIARVYHRDTQMRPWGVRELVWPLALGAIPVLSILMEPDMGTALIVVLLFGSMMLFVGIRRSIIAAAVVALVVMAVSYPVWKEALKSHQQERIEIFFNPEKDPTGAGYNALQAKIAVGSGGLTGKGFQKGRTHMLRFLPEQQTDFVFGVWAEEWGFLWVFVTLALYFGVVYLGIRATQEAKDRFGVMLALGCCALLFWHIFINIAMVVGLFPVIGVPLPFMSYGGSNLMTFMIAAALIINVRMRKFFF
jgi:rod shape determining protein RodA